MTFVYLTNSIGLHQVAVADEIYKILGDNFKFIELSNDDASLGIHKEAEQGLDYTDRSYILSAYKSSENMTLARRLINEADALRCGSVDASWLEVRTAQKKLTFWTTERLFKKKLNAFGPRCIRNCIRLNTMFRKNPNMYLLANGAYVADDFRFYPSIRKHILQWGYFPLFRELDIDSLLASKPKDKIQLLWCARMIDWKHPEMVPKLAKRLKDTGIINFHIKMVGTGIMSHTIKNMIHDLGVSDYVEMIGGLSNDKVISEMQESNIFVFTSDRQEGWGGVLNEAMNAGCAVISADEIGATRFLIKDNDNGLIFKSCNIDDLYKKVVQLMSDEQYRRFLAKNAYHTIKTDYNPKTAARRIVDFSQSVLNGDCTFYKDSICSLI